MIEDLLAAIKISVARVQRGPASKREHADTENRIVPEVHHFNSCRGVHGLPATKLDPITNALWFRVRRHKRT